MNNTVINLLGFEIKESEYDKYRTQEGSAYIDVDKLIADNCRISKCVDSYSVQDRYDDTSMVLRTIKNMLKYQGRIALEKEGYTEGKAIFGGFQTSNLLFNNVKGEECFVLNVIWEDDETRVEARVKSYITGETYTKVYSPVKK